MSEVEKLINGLLRLQDKLVRENDDPWIKERIDENVGNVAMLAIYDDEGITKVTLKLDSDMKIRKTNEEPKHVITMHVDTFLDLLSGNLDFRDAYLKGWLDFQGEDYHYHCLMWAKSFEGLRGKLRKYGVI